MQSLKSTHLTLVLIEFVQIMDALGEALTFQGSLPGLQCHTFVSTELPGGATPLRGVLKPGKCSGEGQLRISACKMQGWYSK